MGKTIAILDNNEAIVKKTTRLWVVDGWHPQFTVGSFVEIFANYEDAKKEFDDRKREAQSGWRGKYWDFKEEYINPDIKHERISFMGYMGFFDIRLHEKQIL